MHRRRLGLSMTLDLPAARERARRTWSAGHFHDIGVLSSPASAHLVRLSGLREGERVLDVGCGTGVTTLVARATGARASGLDITPELLAEAKQHAAIAGFEDIEWREGDAEALPYDDASFDVVLSTFGHMFAPRPEAAARELVRVLRPGGRLAVATWPPESFPGQHLSLAARALGNPADAPLRWGRPDEVRRLLGDAVEEVRFEWASERFVLPAPSPEHVWRLFSESFGPTVRAIEALRDDPARLDAFRREWTDVARAWWRDGRVLFQYLATTARRRA